MARRGENIYKRKDGRWEGRIKSTDIASGKPLYRSIYGRTYRETKEKMNAARQSQIIKTSSVHITLAEASRLWAQSGENNWKSSTCAVYHQLLNKYILPYLGTINISNINNEVMENFVIRIMNTAEQKQLSKNYLSQICLVVRRIISYMNQKYDYHFPIPCNPITGERSRQIVLPAESALAVLENYLYDNIESDTCLGILLALHTGIRIGELSALKWDAINLEEGVIYITHNILRIKDFDSAFPSAQNITHIINQSPKTSDSVRVVPIPPALLPILRTYRKRDSDYVVSGVRNPWAEPRTIQYRFKSILKKCQIEYFNFHMLRHSFASRCVAMGLDIKSLSEILGHSSIRITLNLYVHSSIQQKKQFMKQYDAYSRQYFTTNP